MALKDWKLVSRVRFPNRKEDNYVNQKNGERLSIRMIRGFRGERLYVISIDNEEVKTFRKLADANKWARDYRKKH